MSEPILERLSRFTPDAGGLDRDALLFAAGRESARPNRGWMIAGLSAGRHPGAFAGPPLAAPDPARRGIDRRQVASRPAPSGGSSNLRTPTRIGQSRPVVGRPRPAGDRTPTTAPPAM